MDLIIDTNGKNLKVILNDNGDYIQNEEINEKHLKHLLPQIDSLLTKKNKSILDVNNFCLVLGPGSFTGIRIGVATVKAFTTVNTSAKIVGINFLDFLSYIVSKTNLSIKKDYLILIKSTSTKFYVADFNNENVKIFEKLLNTSEIEQFLKEKDFDMYSYEEEFIINNKKTKRINVLSGNYINYVEYLKEKQAYCSNENLKPIYLALSQAEEELLKKENNNKV